jgi:hypothetical protein
MTRHALDCGTSCGLLCCDCGAEPYRVYRCRPTTERTGEVTTNEDGTLTKWHRVKEWRLLGTAAGYEDAKRKFGGYPVVERYAAQN